jgi:hypothetical protein
VKIYVCWGTFNLPGGHACGRAYHALLDAGYDPAVQRVYGEGRLPAFLNPTRKVVRDLTGQQMVPVLQLEDGEIISGSREIIAWAHHHPASPGDAP